LGGGIAWQLWWGGEFCVSKEPGPRAGDGGEGQSEIPINGLGSAPMSTKAFREKRERSGIKRGSLRSAAERFR